MWHPKAGAGYGFRLADALFGTNMEDGFSDRHPAADRVIRCSLAFVEEILVLVDLQKMLVWPD